MDTNLETIDPKSLLLTEPIPLTMHPAAVYLASLGSGSVPTMKGTLDEIASILTQGVGDAMTLNWAKLRYQHTAAIRTILKQRYAGATANRMLCALRRVLQEAYRLELMSANDYAKAVDIGSVKGSSSLRGRALTGEEIAALMESCDASNPIDVRDRALIALLRGGGLRRAEVVKLDLSDFDPVKGVVEVRQGKGGKSRTVYLSDEAVEFVECWLDERGCKSGPLLCPVRKGGRVEVRRMTPDAVLKIIRRRAEQAGVESFSPHDFRRTFCSDLLDAGVDIVTVQKLAGHASPVTTAKYDRRGEEAKRRAAQRLGF